MIAPDVSRASLGKRATRLGAQLYATVRLGGLAMHAGLFTRMQPRLCPLPKRSSPAWT
jgi:hypothetical protein